MNDLEISVIICAYSDERWQDLQAAVRSVESQSLRPAEIIVVIDHNDALLARVRATFPGVTAAANEGAQGLSGARNTGVRMAHSPVLAFLDDDAIAEANWLATLAVAYEDPAVMGAGGAIEPLWAAGRPRWFPEEFDWIVGCTYRGLPERPAPLRNLIGANMSFRRALFDAVGGFRSEVGRLGTLPMGCEETELCIRAGQRWPGQVFLYIPSARVYHRVPASRAAWRYFRERSYAEGLSKAQIGRLVGTRAGLATELRYTLGTLLVGVTRNLRDAIAGRDTGALARAGAIVAGLFVTTVGYLSGKMMRQAIAGRGA